MLLWPRTRPVPLILLIALAVLGGPVAAAHAEQASSDLRSFQAGLIEAGGDATCGIRADGAARCWGADGLGLLGNGPGVSPNQQSPGPVALPAGRSVRSISVSSHACATLDDGSAWCWGPSDFGQTGGDGGQTPGQVNRLPPGRSVRAVSTGGIHTCSVRDDGSAQCWGDANNGALGRTSPGGPVALPAGRTARAITGGALHSCAIGDDGSAWCWGNDGGGRLGNGSGLGAQGTPSTVLLPAGRSARAISAGVTHTCAVLDDGTASCWGSDANGKLGNGPSLTTDQQSPSTVALPAGRSAIAISAGQAHTCAVLDDGSAWCWGDDTNGKLGNGSGPIGDQVSPTQVVLPVGRSARAISAGNAHTCAVLDDGSATCWGSDANGKLGNGPTSTGDIPDPSTATGVVGFSVPATVADLSAGLSVTPGAVSVGQQAAAVVTVANAGPDAAEQTRVAVSLPGLGVAAAAPSQGSFDAASGIWNAGSVASGGAATLVLTVTAFGPGSFAGSAEVIDAAQPDPDSIPANAGVEDDRASAAYSIAPVPPQVVERLVPANVDTTAPRVSRSVPKSISRDALLSKGIAVTATPSESSTVLFELLVSAKTASIAAAKDLVLASKSFPRGTSKRSSRLKPVAKLLRKPSKAFNVRVRITAVDASRNATVSTSTVKVTIPKKKKPKKR